MLQAPGCINASLEEDITSNKAQSTRCPQAFLMIVRAFITDTEKYEARLLQMIPPVKDFFADAVPKV